MRILIKNGHLIDPINKIDAIMDILIENSKISQVAKEINSKADKVIDAKGKFVAPGLIDMHVHLREPGREDKETIATGTLAALKGGITTVLAMPNTSPAIDSSENVRMVENIIKKTANANVLICAAITKGRLGEELTDAAKLKKAGVVALTDDGSSVADEKLLLGAFKQAKKEKMLLICHSEDKKISGNGVINLGAVSTRLGLRGIPRESEHATVKRDIELARQAKSAVHIAHVSCAESVKIIAEAKKKGAAVTAETAPHYFSLHEEGLFDYDTNLKMNPPLRTESDIAAIKEGLKKGIIDAIASDHAPHTENEKDIEFDRAEFGVIGLETELAVSITELVQTGILSWAQLIEKLSVNPARILGVDRGNLKAGSTADLIIFSGDQEWVVKKEELISKSKNSPFLNRKLEGVIEYTLLGGKIVYEGNV